MRASSVLLIACSCTGLAPMPDLSLPQGRGPKSIDPVVIERSAPLAPPWTQKVEPTADDAVDFVGFGIAPSLDAAQRAADRDLMASIGSYVSVEITFASSVLETDDQIEVAETVATRANAKLDGIAPAGTYWERSESPLVEGESTYRYFARATVPKESISRARLAGRRARRERNAREQVVLLPFGDGDPLAEQLYEAVSTRLARSDRVALIDPELARAIKDLDRASELLLADRILVGEQRQVGDRIRLTLVEHDGEGRPRAVHTSIEKKGELSRLALTMAHEIDAQIAEAPAKRTAAALEAKADAARLLRESKLDEALAAIARAIEADPGDAAVYLRAGRILERMGRLARIEVTTRARANVADAPLSCTAEGASAIATARSAIELRSSAAASVAGAWWSADTLEVSDALELALGSLNALPQVRWNGQWVGVMPGTLMRIGPDEQHRTTSLAPALTRIIQIWGDGKWAQIEAPESGWVPIDRLTSDLDLRIGPQELIASTPTQPTSAAEAYLRSLAGADDRRETWDAALALADLGVRADRHAPAFSIYEVIVHAAEADGDLHRASLARYGWGAGLRKIGRLEEADRQLLAALQLRRLGGEKPYLLEIYNELGQLEVERDRLDLASDYFMRALRLAEEIDDAYLASVLANNLGVLDLRAGRLAAALDRFDQAWRTLTDQQAAFGRTASGLNFGLASARRGDVETGRQQLAEVSRIVDQTMQESALAELRASQGTLALLEGRPEEALAPLAEAWLYEQRLGRSTTALKLQGSLLSAEAQLPGAEKAHVDCLAYQLWFLGAPVFEPRLQPAETIDELAPHALSREDLLLALSAAALLAITDFRPEWAAYRAPEAALPVPAIEPRVPAPKLGSDRAANIRILIGAIRKVRSRIGKMSADARLQRDVVRLSCLDETIAQIEALLRSSIAAAASDPMTEHEYSKIEIAHQRSLNLDAGAEQCLGHAYYEIQETVVLAEETPAPAQDSTSPSYAPPPPPPTARYQRATASYERILGAFSAEPGQPLLLDPTQLSRWPGQSDKAARMLEAIATHFGARGDLSLRAAALLDLGAARWFDGEGDAAYHNAMEARRLFARIGDRRGLAHADEWIGFFMLKSDRPDLAADHLRLARDLFESLGDQRSAARAISY